MKKIKLGTVEVLGCIGLLIWAAVILLRQLDLSENTFYIFTLGVLPNLGAAWVVTLFGKWACLFIMRQPYSTKKHLILSLVIIALALASESVHDAFLATPFDRHDILLTLVAQVIILLLPSALNDKYFERYE
jgi:hypothetical protein